MQICCPRKFGKRRHSGDWVGKSQLKTPFLMLILRHWEKYCGLTGKMINKVVSENACAPFRV
ncbi:hypothetical protein HMPREF0880_00568 [Yokenella regensburgei ATCC 43003]|jgi:hypothetical protein|nr:hypothetical protein HMPREF0880_00568 [Yokenella regensburgei ATCC 43003]